MEGGEREGGREGEGRGGSMNDNKRKAVDHIFLLCLPFAVLE